MPIPGSRPPDLGRPHRRARNRVGFSAVLRQLLLAAPIRLWALIAGAPAVCAYVAWGTWIIWRGPWEQSHQKQQLDILGWGLWGAIGLVAVIVISLAALKVSAETKLGTFRVEGDDEDRPPVSPPL